MKLELGRNLVGDQSEETTNEGKAHTFMVSVGKRKAETKSQSNLQKLTSLPSGTGAVLVTAEGIHTPATFLKTH